MCSFEAQPNCSMKQAWDVRSFMWVCAQPQNTSDVEPAWQARNPMVDLGMDLRKNTSQASGKQAVNKVQKNLGVRKDEGASNPSMVFRQSRRLLSSFHTVSCAGSKTTCSSPVSLIEAQPGHQFHANLRTHVWASSASTACRLGG